MRLTGARNSKKAQWKGVRKCPLFIVDSRKSFLRRLHQSGDRYARKCCYGLARIQMSHRARFRKRTVAFAW
jgi:hypothetical protein